MSQLDAWVAAQAVELEQFLASAEGKALMARLADPVREIEFGKDVDHGVAEIVLLSSEGIRFYEGAQGNWVAYASRSDLASKDKGYSPATAQQAVEYLLLYNRREYQESMSVVEWLKGKVK